MGTDEPGQREYERRSADIAALRAANAGRMARLGQQGVQVNLMPPLLDALIDALLPEGSEQRLDFLKAWETKASGLLDDIEAQVRRQMLLAPGAVPANGRKT